MKSIFIWSTMTTEENHEYINFLLEFSFSWIHRYVVDVTQDKKRLVMQAFVVHSFAAIICFSF